MRAVEPPLAAVAFLTRIPVGRLAELDGAAVRRAAPLFPLVGGAIGALAGGVVDVAAGPLPSLGAAALGLGVAALLTGALHLDALADTADALGGTTRERRLEIMRDHAIGAFGAVALVVVLLFEASLLASETSAWSAFAAAAACGRWAALPLAAFLPAARAEGTALSNLSVVSVALGLLAACGVAVGVRGLEGLAAVGAAIADRARARPVLPPLARRRHGRHAGRDERARAGCRARRAPRRMTRLLLIRHAEPDEAARGRCYGRLDVGLSPTGLASAERLAESLRAVELDAVYVSPRLRAVQTAAALDTPRTVDDRLRELDFGHFEGRTYDEIEREQPEFFRSWMETPTLVRFPGGESYADLRERVSAALDDIVTANDGRTVALVSHGGVIRAALAVALGLPDDRAFALALGYARISIVDVFDGTPIVRLVNGASADVPVDL